MCGKYQEGQCGWSKVREEESDKKETEQGSDFPRMWKGMDLNSKYDETPLKNF